MARSFGGATEDDIRLWNTYLYWARSELAPASTRHLVIGTPRFRIPDKKARALRAIVLTAFVLEYRIKRVYEEIGVQFKHTDTLGRLLKDMQPRVQACKRLDRSSKIRLPPSWPRLYDKLLALKDLRNLIAHAKYVDLRPLLALPPSTLLRRAQTNFNILIRTIRVLNVATGYDTRPHPERRTNYGMLHISSLHGA